MLTQQVPAQDSYFANDCVIVGGEILGAVLIFFTAMIKKFCQLSLPPADGPNCGQIRE